MVDGGSGQHGAAARSRVMEAVRHAPDYVTAPPPPVMQVRHV